jgi:hypothetical protein
MSSKDNAWSEGSDTTQCPHVGRATLVSYPLQERGGSARDIYHRISSLPARRFVTGLRTAQQEAAEESRHMLT